MDKNIDELIDRWLEGKSSPEEAEMLDFWLAEDEKHVDYFFRCKNLYDVCHPAFEPNRIDEKKAWGKVVPLVAKRRWLSVRWSVAAAVVLLCIGLSGFWLISLREDVGKIPVATVHQEIQPEQAEGITLMLSTGERVVLAESADCELVTSDGVVAQQKGNAMSYGGQDSICGENIFHVLDVPYGKEFFLVLSDSTKVWVNAGSRVRYLVCFARNERKIFVEGEVFLEVAHNEAAPFKVVTTKEEITVLGTTFNVKAYPEETVRQVTLVSGKVNVFLPESGQQVVLSPNEQAILRDGARNIQKCRVDTEVYCGWHEGKLVFRSHSLEEISRILTRRYDLHVEWTSESLKSVSYSGEIEHAERIEDVLKVMQHTGDVKFELNGKKLIIGRP